MDPIEGYIKANQTFSLQLLLSTQARLTLLQVNRGSILYDDILQSLNGSGGDIELNAPELNAHAALLFEACLAPVINAKSQMTLQMKAEIINNDHAFIKSLLYVMYSRTGGIECAPVEDFKAEAISFLKKNPQPPAPPVAPTVSAYGRMGNANDPVYGGSNGATAYRAEDPRAPGQQLDVEKSEPIVKLLAEVRKVGMDVLFPQTVHDKILASIFVAVKAATTPAHRELIDMVMAVKESNSVTQLESVSKTKVRGVLALLKHAEILVAQGTEGEPLRLYLAPTVTSFRDLRERHDAFLSRFIMEQHLFIPAILKAEVVWQFEEEVKTQRLEAIDKLISKLHFFFTGYQGNLAARPTPAVPDFRREQEEMPNSFLRGAQEPAGRRPAAGYNEYQYGPSSSLPGAEAEAEYYGRRGAGPVPGQGLRYQQQQRPPAAQYPPQQQPYRQQQAGPPYYPNTSKYSGGVSYPPHIAQQSQQYMQPRGGPRSVSADYNQRQAPYGYPSAPGGSRDPRAGYGYPPSATSSLHSGGSNGYDHMQSRGGPGSVPYSNGSSRDLLSASASSFRPQYGVSDVSPYASSSHSLASGYSGSARGGAVNGDYDFFPANGREGTIGSGAQHRDGLSSSSYLSGTSGNGAMGLGLGLGGKGYGYADNNDWAATGRFASGSLGGADDLAPASGSLGAGDRLFQFDALASVLPSTSSPTISSLPLSETKAPAPLISEPSPLELGRSAPSVSTLAPPPGLFGNAASSQAAISGPASAPAASASFFDPIDGLSLEDEGLGGLESSSAPTSAKYPLKQSQSSLDALIDYGEDDHTATETTDAVDDFAVETD